MNKPHISIQSKIQVVFIRMMMFLVITILINMISSYLFSLQYNQLITNVEYTNILKEKVESQIYLDTWNIVSGTNTFEESNQYVHINEIYDGIEYLVEHTTLAEGSTQLEVAKRTTETLENYMDHLGEAIESSVSVDEMLEIHEDIRNVSLLVSDVLQEYVYFEINNAARINNIMQITQAIILIIDIVIIVVFISMVIKTKDSLTRSINEPLYELEMMAGKIARGEFETQVKNSGVQELESLTSSLNVMARQIESLIQENNRERDNLMKAELNLLQAQIKPHFLYNTYDTIIWLAEKNQIDDVIKVVEALTAYYRVALSKGNEWIRIENEITHIESYLIIQHFRYGQMMNYTVNVDPEIYNTFVLKLLLQPIVENSIYHGIKYLRGRGSIEIKGYKEDGYIYFIVRDTGIGMEKDTLETLRKQVYETSGNEEESGYGLRNVNLRIKLYYGRGSDMLIESEQGIGTTITIKLPIMGIMTRNISDGEEHV